MNHCSPNGTYPSTLSPDSRFSVKKRLKSRKIRAKCSFLDDEIGIENVAFTGDVKVDSLEFTEISHKTIKWFRAQLLVLKITWESVTVSD